MRYPPHRGFVLIELFLTIGLIAVAFTIAIPLMHWSILTTSAAQNHSAMSLRFDGATAQLRADIWQATALQITGKPNLFLQQPDGANIIWKIGPGDRLERNGKSWTNLGITANTNFVADGSAVRLLVPTRPDGSWKSITFLSQMGMMTGGARP